MITLYHSPDSRSSRFIWLLEEMGEKYEIVYCSIVRRAGGTVDPKNAHPEKRVPALMHEGQLVTEQVAIALYLTDTFPRQAWVSALERHGALRTWYGSPSTRAKWTRSMSRDGSTVNASMRSRYVIKPGS